MPFDFTGFQAPEGFPADALNNEQFKAAINESFDKQIAAHTSTYDEKVNKATRDKAIADQKIEDLQNKLKQMESQGSGNDELDKVKAELAKAKENAAAEYTPQLEALKQENEKYKAENGELQNNLTRKDITDHIRNSIAEYNAKYPAVEVESEGEQYVIDAALKQWQKIEGGEFRAFDGDKPITSSSGFITGPEYIAALRDKPGMGLFFKQPKGGGASGGNGGGAGDKTMTRSQFGALPPSEQAQVATTHKIIDG